jgi:hypothetical protein
MLFDLARVVGESDMQGSAAWLMCVAERLDCADVELKEAVVNRLVLLLDGGISAAFNSDGSANLASSASMISTSRLSSNIESSSASSDSLFAVQSSSGTLGSRAPLFASLSAPSFPSIPACPSTYCICTFAARQDMDVILSG